MKYSFKEADLILAIRKLYGYSQQEFCLLLECSQSTLSKIENGISSPDMKFVISLSQKLNLDLNIFRYGVIPKISQDLFASKASRMLRHPFLKDGIFTAKTTFFLLELIEENLKIDIYKKLGLLREQFVFSELKYGKDLFKELLSLVDYLEIIQMMETFKKDSGPNLIAEETFKACLMELNLVHLKNIKNGGAHFEIGLSLRKEHLFQEQKTNEFFQHLVAFHVLNELNINVTLKREKKVTQDFLLLLNAG
jgi:transcriptional regulator with XRE-family HTH domain